MGLVLVRPAPTLRDDGSKTPKHRSPTSMSARPAAIVELSPQLTQPCSSRACLPHTRTHTHVHAHTHAHAHTHYTCVHIPFLSERSINIKPP